MCLVVWKYVPLCLNEKFEVLWYDIPSRDNTCQTLEDDNDHHGYDDDDHDGHGDDGDGLDDGDDINTTFHHAGTLVSHWWGNHRRPRPEEEKP